MGRDAKAMPAQRGIQLGVVAEAFPNWPLNRLLDWLLTAAPDVTAVELGSGGYAPHPHCERAALLADAGTRARWLQGLSRRGFSIAALNVWGNPLHPDTRVGLAHDRDLRETIQLAAELGTDRIVALAGCPAAVPGDRSPHFAGGGWLPYLEDVFETQWEAAVGPYWSAISDFAAAEHPQLRICIELHPGTVAYNVETFSRLRQLGDNLYATIDPSHFFWQQMDAEAVIAALRPYIGHVHAKDLVFDRQRLAVDGLLDHRWRGSSPEVPWRFATVGGGHDRRWWSDFVGWMEGTSVSVIAIEHEDMTISPEVGVTRAAQILAQALAQSEFLGAATSR